MRTLRMRDLFGTYYSSCDGGYLLRCGGLSRGLAALEEQEKSIHEDTRRLAQAKKRLADIDVLMTRICEDMVLGNLSRERYRKMA